jgi:hypothetical protein
MKGKDVRESGAVLDHETPKGSQRIGITLISKNEVRYACHVHMINTFMCVCVCVCVFSHYLAPLDFL